MDPVPSPRRFFTRRVLVTVRIVAVITIFLLALGYFFAYIVLLVFAGILLAVSLRGLAA